MSNIQRLGLIKGLTNFTNSESKYVIITSNVVKQETETETETERERERERERGKRRNK